MVILLAAGRGLRDQQKLFSTLDYWSERLGFTRLVHGGHVSISQDDRALAWELRAKWGGDHFAQLWAKSRHVQEEADPISDQEIKSLGRGAAAIRNRRALDRHKPDRVISIEPDEAAEDLIAQARARGIRCIEAA